MSMATVRAAIAAYLTTGIATSTQDAAIPGLNQVYRGMPTFIDPSRWWVLPPELGSGTIGYIHLAKVDEDRIALPAVTGGKFVEYVVALVLIYRYMIPSGAQVPPLDGDEWVDGYDATLEGVKAYIRADPHLGTAPATATNDTGVIYDRFPDVIWQAGQTQGDLAMTSDLPFRDEDGGEVLSFQVIEFHVTEAITA